MNTPNKLTIFRILLTPIFLALFIYKFDHHFLYAFVVFAIACITDFIDGKLARKNDQITILGKLLDPLADKILTTAALLGFFKFQLCSIWVIIIILTREFAVTGVRSAASAQGIVIPANIWGKIKTATQMIFSVMIIFAAEVLSYWNFNDAGYFSLIANVMMWITALFTVISGLKYILDSRKVLDFTK